MKPVRLHESTTETLITGNPMMAEVGRNLKKMAGYNLPAPARKAGLYTLGAIYAFCLVLIILYRGGPIADVAIYLQTLGFCLIVPSVTHNAIVGERERRSWDMLLVAPVTPMQIVVAKYATGVTTLGLAVAAILPAAFIGAIGSNHSLTSLLAAEAVSLSFGICLNAFALAVSARAKRALHAQTAIFGTASGLLLFWPMIISILAPANTGLLLTLNLLNPFMLLAHLLNTNAFGASSPFDWLTGWQIGFYLLASLYFLRSAHRNVMRDIQQDGD